MSLARPVTFPYGRCLITGAGGSIGAALCDTLRGMDTAYRATDIEGMDVCDLEQTAEVIRDYQPDVIFHLAAAKHAPQGEDDPLEVSRTNAGGTWNVIRAAALEAPDTRIVTASTCKACDPETAYGASKLIAERMTLNAGGSVARFYNVPESSGNVFRIWEDIPADEPLPVTPCTRYFICIEDAVSLLLWTAVLAPARYTVDPGPAKSMAQVAAEMHPGRPLRFVDARRGDRHTEPRKAACEILVPAEVAGLERVESPHDDALGRRVASTLAAAAVSAAAVLAGALTAILDASDLLPV